MDAGGIEQTKVLQKCHMASNTAFVVSYAVAVSSITGQPSAPKEENAVSKNPVVSSSLGLT